MFVYCIHPTIDHDPAHCYIGSTANPHRRLITHRSNYRSYKKGRYRLVSLFNIFDQYTPEMCTITILEEVVGHKIDLLKREEYHINSRPCVNIVKTTYQSPEERTAYLKSYYKAHADQYKEYYQNNRERIRAQQNARRAAKRALQAVSHEDVNCGVRTFAEAHDC